MPNKAVYSPLKNTSRATSRGVVQRERAHKVAHSLLVSFQYAAAGLLYAFVTQRNFRIHTIIGTVALTLAFLLHLPAVHLAVIVLTASLVMILELINTAIEAVVDLAVGTQYHELAKIAKDCAAAAVLLGAIAALGVAGVLLFPPLLNLFWSIQLG